MSEATTVPMEAPATPSRPAWPGTGLLGSNLENVRHRLTMLLIATYSKLGNNQAENFALWQRTRVEINNTVRSWFRDLGLESAPMFEDAFMRRVAPIALPRDSDAYVHLVHALFTDYGNRFSKHLLYRLRTEGNVHLEITGPTGMAKSSCAIAIADWVRPIEPARLLRHVNFDLSELTDKLDDKEPGDSVIQDEFLQLTGEGAVTASKFFSNLEDTLRKSQINLFVCSPRRHEHATMQATLEAIAWNPTQQWSTFLVWVGDAPMGLIAVPWCRAKLWREYSTFKDQNVERTKDGAFRDRRQTARVAMRLFNDPLVRRHLIHRVRSKKKKRSDFEDAIELCRGDTMSVSQRQRVANFMFNVSRSFHVEEATFEQDYGVPINDGLRAVAESMRVKTDDEDGEAA